MNCDEPVEGARAEPPASAAQPPRRQRRHGGVRAGGPALEAKYQFLLWLIPTLEKFPRSQKFQLGDRLQNDALDVLQRLIEATYTRKRLPLLRAANLGLEKLRFGPRLAKDLRHLDLQRYEHAARAVDEVGRLVGGWARSDKAAAGGATHAAET